MLISYIIPVYNAENFIEKCVGSILDQPISRHLFEIILVNDGSRDRSHEICLGIQKDHEVVKYFQKDNAGPGHTRNYGLERAKGKYIWFIDADDYLEPGVVNDFVNHLNEDLDLYIFGYRAINLDGEEIRKEGYVTEKLSSTELLRKGRYVNMVWCKLIRKEILDDHHIRFKEDIRGPEDFHLSFRLISVVNEIKTLNIVAYNYIENPASLMNTRSQAHMQKLGDDSITAVNDLRPYLNTMDHEKKSAFQSWISNFLYGLLLSFVRFNYSREYVASALDRLHEKENYPFTLPANNWKKKLFINLSTNRTLFLWLVAIKRSLGK